MGMRGMKLSEAKSLRRDSEWSDVAIAELGCAGEASNAPVGELCLRCEFRLSSATSRASAAGRSSAP